MDVKNYRLDSRVDTNLSDELELGTGYPGRSTAFQLTEDTVVTFTNCYTPLPDITVTKVDSVDGQITLEGAEFYLINSKNEYYCYDVSSDTTSWVTDKDAATSLTSAENGTFTINNLVDGTYVLQEITAPDGYQLPTENITFAVSDGEITDPTGDCSVGADFVTITVKNTAGGDILPETGGAGTTMNTIGGLLLMTAAAGGGYGLRRRRGKGGR